MMMSCLPGNGRTTSTFLSACLLSCCHALRSCGEELQCGEGQQCCPPVFFSGNGSVSSPVRCCKLPIHVFFDNVGWVTRKLSGILILLLLFAMGYFIQRIICPRPRRRHPSGGHNDRPEEPGSSLFHGHATASQDSLLERYPEYSLGDFGSPMILLPAYDEVKYLPTYEESMQESMHRDRSDDNLLCENERTGPGRGGAAAEQIPGQQRQDAPEVSESVSGHQHSYRGSRNSV